MSYITNAIPVAGVFSVWTLKDSYDNSHSSTLESTIIMHKLPGLSYMVIVKRLDLTLQS